MSASDSATMACCAGVRLRLADQRAETIRIKMRQRRCDQIANDDASARVTGLPSGNEFGGQNGRLTLVTEQTATNMEKRFHDRY